MKHSKSIAATLALAFTLAGCAKPKPTPPPEPPRTTADEKPLAPATDRAVPTVILVSLNDSAAYQSNLRWHRYDNADEIRMSWFLSGNPGIAMECTANLSTHEARSLRHVYNWARQGGGGPQKLNHVQMVTLKRLSKRLPPSIQPTEVAHLVIVSAGEKENRKLYAYDRRFLPAEIVRLYDLTGAYISTEEKPQKPAPAK